MSWQTLGGVAPTALLDARLQLHHAAQIVASAGITFLDPQPDDSHPNLGWSETLGALMGRSLPGRDVQVGLSVAALSLLLVDKDGRVREEFELDGRRLEDGYAWLATMTSPAGALTRASYAIPDHATARGERFSNSSPGAFAELAHWFANGQDSMTKLAERNPEASELRCWPHHFDLGMLVVVATQPDGSLAKSIGVGLSPGDDSYAEPYFYVSPWPYPDPSALPELADGAHWHTDGHTSAILTGSDLVTGSADHQCERLDAFLNASVDASGRALAG